MKELSSKEIKEIFKGKCFACKVCDGRACAGIIPGMGGPGNSNTFKNNYRSWQEIDAGDLKGVKIPKIGVGPMTGVVENIGGYLSEREFQHTLVKGAKKAGVFSTTGDGAPDYKFFYGLEALKDNEVQGYVFIKPYENHKIIERIKSIEQKVSGIGIDIDSAELINMKGKAKLEYKTAEQLLEIKKTLGNTPFIIKGIYSEQGLDIIKKVKPYGVIVSNHGGRVFDDGEGIAYFLKRFGKELKEYCKEIWVDGGLRTKEHLLKASALGADKVLIARPFAVYSILNSENGIKDFLNENNICI